MQGVTSSFKSLCYLFPSKYYFSANIDSSVHAMVLSGWGKDLRSGWIPKIAKHVW